MPGGELDLMWRGSVPLYLSGHHLHAGDESHTKLMEQKLWGSDLGCLSSLLHLWSSPRTTILSLRRNSIGAKGVLCGSSLMAWVGCSGPARRQRQCLQCSAYAGAGINNGFHWMGLHYSFYSWSLPLAPAALTLLWAGRAPLTLSMYQECRLSQSSHSKQVGPPMMLPV